MAMRKKTGSKQKAKQQEATNETPSEPQPQDRNDDKSLVMMIGPSHAENDAQTGDQT